MNDNEKQIIKDLLIYIEFLHYKVKVHDDVLERVLKKKPDLIPSDLMARIEEGNKNIAVANLADIKKRVLSL